MKKSLRAFLVTTALMAAASPAFAETAAAAETAHAAGGRMSFFVAVAILSIAGMGLTSIAVSWAQSYAIRTAIDGIARNPGAASKIFPLALVGLAMMESLAIYVLVIVLILLFANPFLKFIS